MFGEIEGTGFEILSSEFANCLTGHGRVERLWTGARWLEGPVWFPAGKYLLISDIPNNRILRWDETDGSVSVFRKPSYCSNGNTIDHQGRLITCEHKSRRVTRTEHNGAITIVADSFNNKKLKLILSLEIISFFMLSLFFCNYWFINKDFLKIQNT